MANHLDQVASQLRLFKRVARLTAYPLVATPVAKTTTAPTTTDAIAQFPGLGNATNVINNNVFKRPGGGVSPGSDVSQVPGGDGDNSDLDALEAEADAAPTNETPEYNYRPAGEGVVIEDLRIRFSIEKSLKRHPNKSTVTVTNMSEQTRKLVEKAPVTFVLEAGHDTVYRLLATGDLHFAKSEIKGPDWETLVQLGDGSRGFNYARVNKSYTRGTSVKTILGDVARSMGQELPDNVLASGLLEGQVASGAVVLGAARDELTRLLAPYGYYWSLQNGKLQILRDDEVGPGQAILINQETGMVGSPAYGNPTNSGKSPTLHIKMLLYPGLMPGNPIQVESRTVNGMFRIETVKHEGDTHGDNWFSEIEARPATAEAVVSPAQTQQTSLAKFPGIGNANNVISNVVFRKP